MMLNEDLAAALRGEGHKGADLLCPHACRLLTRRDAYCLASAARARSMIWRHSRMASSHTVVLSKLATAANVSMPLKANTARPYDICR